MKDLNSLIDPNDNGHERPYVEIFTNKYFSSPQKFYKLKTTQKSTPDYIIPEPKCVVEVKRIMDGEHANKSRAWSRTTSLLKEAIKNLSEYRRIHNSYLVSSGYISFGQNNPVMASVARDLLDAIITYKENLLSNGVNFTIRQIEEGRPGVYFSASGGGFMDSVRIINENLIRHIRKANDKQFPEFRKQYEFDKAIVLLVNWYPYGMIRSDIIKALVKDFTTISNLEKVDEIWCIDHFDLQAPPGQPYKICDKTFFGSYRDGWQHADRLDTSLFNLWFGPLNNGSIDHKEKILKGYFHFTEVNTPDSMFSQSTRVEAIKLASWLCDEKRFDEARSIFASLLNDPDPLHSPSEEDQEDLANQLAKGTSVHQITTVLGYLAWGIKKLRSSKNHINDVIGFTSKLLQHPNLYVRYEALVPLLETGTIWAWCKKHLDKKIYDGFKADILESVEKYAKNPAFSERIGLLLNNYRDISEQETCQILANIGTRPEYAAAHMIYNFGWYGEGPYSKVVDNQIEKLIESQCGNPPFLGKMLWLALTWMSNEADKLGSEANKLHRTIDKIVDLPYDNSIHGNFECFAYSLTKEYPTLMGPWLIKVGTSFFKSMDAPVKGYHYFPLNENLCYLYEQTETFMAGIDLSIDMLKYNIDVGFPGALIETGDLHFGSDDSFIKRIRSLVEASKSYYPKLTKWLLEHGLGKYIE